MYIYIYYICIYLIFQGPCGTPRLVQVDFTFSVNVDRQEDAVRALSGLWDVQPQFRDISQTPSRDVHPMGFFRPRNHGFRRGYKGLYIYFGPYTGGV